MIGKIKDYDGNWYTLPPLLYWELSYSDGKSADSFSVCFQFEAAWESRLKKAVRFQAEENGVTRFFGIVDEYEVTLDDGGLCARLYGRGMAGLLLDNQVRQREYYYARLSDMVRNYVTPYGIAAPSYRKNVYLSAYAVDYGESAWDAFSGFCLWAMDIQPRFLSDGTLVVSSRHGTGKAVEDSSPILEAKHTGCRYGVYSAVVAKYISSGYEQRFENREFQKRGGCATYRMTVPRRNRCRAGLFSAPKLLSESGKQEQGLTVTLWEPFWAQPMDEVTVNLTALGLHGTFLVKEAKSSGNASGTSCCLTMYQI